MGVSSSVRKPVFTIMPCLLAVLLLSLSISTIHAFTSVVLKNDDGSREAWSSTTKGNHLFVRFDDLPYSIRLVMVEFFVNEPGVSFMFHVYSGERTHLTHLYEDEAMLQPELDPRQWVQVHVMKEIIVGPGISWVSVEYATDNKPGIGLDATTFNDYHCATCGEEQWDLWETTRSRSYQGTLATLAEPFYSALLSEARLGGDLMIRVQAERLDISPRERVVEASGTGLGFVVIAVGAGVAAAAGGLAVAISQPRSEVYASAGYYYCRKHRTPVWSVEGRLWCPVERRFLKP